MTREPRVSDSATFSPACRHTLQRRNSASPSFHSWDWRSKVRGVEATVKLATAAPLGVKRSSGSAVRLPTTVMTVSPATGSPRCSLPAVCGTSSVWVRPPRWRTSSTGEGWCRGPTVELAQLGAEDLRAQDRLVEVELAVQLLHDGRLGVEVDDRVDAFSLLVDLERQPAPAPHVDLLHGAAAGADDVEERVERGSDGPLLEVGVEDDHELVVTQQTHLLLWTMRLRTLRSRRVFASANSEDATRSVDGDGGAGPSVPGLPRGWVRKQQPNQ